MSAPAAIKATFADFKLVRGRKVAQLVFEVPIEQGDAALHTLGGLPSSIDERWCALARLNPEKLTSETPKPAERREGGKRWEELTLPQQAGIRCADPEFQYWCGAKSQDEARLNVLRTCGITSRAELATNEQAARLWRQLDSEFQIAQRGGR